MDTMNVRGTKVEVHTTIDHNFAATWNNNYYSSPTWDGLRKKLLVASKNLKIEVPFFEVRNAAAGVATGIHTNSGNILVRWANGKTDQLSSWNGANERLRCLSDEEVAEFVSLKAAVVTAEKAFKKFRDDRAINLKQVVLDAIKALEATATETD